MNLKKITLTTLSLLICLGTLGIIADSLPAEAQDSTAFERSVDDRLDQLTESMAQLVDIVSQTVETSEVPTVDPETGLPEGAEYRSFNTNTTYHFQNTTCFTDYLTWPSSNTFKEDAEWSPAKMPSSWGTGYFNYVNNKPYNQFTDLNGDGMLDFIYSYHKPGVTPVYEEGPTGVSTPSGTERYTVSMRDCVLLNTGAGWEYAYRCYTSGEQYGDPVGLAHAQNPIPRYNTRPLFYGDCADTTNP